MVKGRGRVEGERGEGGKKGIFLPLVETCLEKGAPCPRRIVRLGIPDVPRMETVMSAARRSRVPGAAIVTSGAPR